MALGGSTSEATEKQKNQHGHVHREVRDMVSAITGRLRNIHHKVGPSHDSDHHQQYDDSDSDNGGGIRIVTLAGTNAGATMRGDLDHEVNHHGNAGKQLGPQPGERADDVDDVMKTYVNSNFQAVNNSIMMGGSYKANDPGVHLDISDPADPHHNKGKVSWKKGNNKNKNKTKNGKDGSKSDGTSTSSSSSSESSD